MKSLRPAQFSVHDKSYVHAVNQLVINWHITESCNYSCQYCYARWKKTRAKGELIHDEIVSRHLLRELKRVFFSRNTSNPLYPSLKWNDLRLSLAGGEPLIYPQRTMQVAREARDLGFKVSLITNSSFLSQEGLDPLFESLSVLGVSIDSLGIKTSRQIGRADNAGHVLSLSDHEKTIENIRTINPKIILKVNTVVNKFNCHEDLSKLVERLKPNKWKVLKVLPVVNDELGISDQEFMSFVKRHQHLGSVMSVENNQKMIESYLMVDPLGRFFQNKPHIKNGDSYSYSQPILQCGAETAFKQISFDVEKFAHAFHLFLWRLSHEIQ